MIGIGIIGYGGFGQFLHRSWSTMAEAVVRAIADTNPNVRRTVDGLDGAVYEDWRTLLADPSINVVSIVTPPRTHAEIACEAMQAGKHVLIEKPLATTYDDAARIRTVAEETGRVVAVDYMLRFNPIVEMLQQWARDGSFGTLRRVIVENYAQDASLPPSHWFWDRDQSGGILVEHAVHFIDIVNGCTDAAPLYVDGLAVKRADGRMDRMGLTAVYADGLVSQQYHSFSRPGFWEETGMRFVFDLAQIDVAGWIPLCGTVNALVNQETGAALHRLPGFDLRERKPLDDVDDASRPEGWGATGDRNDEQRANASRPHTGEERSESGGDYTIRSGGVAYGVTEQVRGYFSLPTSKLEAYSSALRSLMADVVTAIRDPDHHLRAGLPEGLRSLEIALTATHRAVGRSDAGEF